MLASCSITVNMTVLCTLIKIISCSYNRYQTLVERGRDAYHVLKHIQPVIRYNIPV